MKKLFVLGTALLLILSLGLIASAKTLKLGLDADPKSIDIHEQLSGGTLQFSHWVFDPLVRYAQDMSFEPRLAKRWERIDKNTMRFHLVKGVKFHSGNDFTAEDVQFTLNRLKTSVDFKGLFELFSEPVIVDKYTVDIVTTKPYGLVLNMMTYIFPLDKKFYTGTDDKGTPKDAVVKVGEGHLSSFTVKRLVNFKKSDDVNKDATLLAKYFLEAGLNVSQEEFIEYYSGL